MNRPNLVRRGRRRTQALMSMKLRTNLGLLRVDFNLRGARREARVRQDLARFPSPISGPDVGCSVLVALRYDVDGGATRIRQRPASRA